MSPSLRSAYFHIIRRACPFLSSSCLRGIVTVPGKIPRPKKICRTKNKPPGLVFPGAAAVFVNSGWQSLPKHSPATPEFRSVACRPLRAPKTAKLLSPVDRIRPVRLREPACHDKALSNMQVPGSVPFSRAERRCALPCWQVKRYSIKPTKTVGSVEYLNTYRRPWILV